jgi:hypothetical protein
MKQATFYLSSGKIDYVVSGDDIVIEESIKASDLGWIEGSWDGATYYVLDGEATLRPDNPTILDNITLRNVPAPCKILINSVAYDVDEETVELDLPMSAKYKIVIEKFPYLDAEFEIET